MSLDPEPDLSDRARHAQRLTDAVLADGQACARIDDLVRSAAGALGADIASLSMLSDRQITVSACAPGAAATPVPGVDRGAETTFEDTICANALRSDEALVIPDAREDPRVASVPAVGAGLVGAYLGSPLRHEGAIVGVLCVASAESRDWSAEHLSTLNRLAAELLAEVVRSASVAVG